MVDFENFHCLYAATRVFSATTELCYWAGAVSWPSGQANAVLSLAWPGLVHHCMLLCSAADEAAGGYAYAPLGISATADICARF